MDADSKATWMYSRRPLKPFIGPKIVGYGQIILQLKF